MIRIRDLLAGETETYFDGPVPADVVVRSGDFVIGMDGDFNSATWTGRPAALNQRLCMLKAKPSIDQRFLTYTIPLPLQAINDVTYSTTVKHLSSLDLLAERIPVPPISVQRAIADYLDAETARIDALIAKKRRMIELLDNRFLERVRVEVTGGMKFFDPLNVRINDINESGWVPTKLGADLTFGSGTTATAGVERYYGDGIPWIVTGDLRDKLITETCGSVTRQALKEFTALRVHPSGALVVAMYGATVGRLGITTFRAAVNQACCVIHSGARINTWFLFYYLLAHRAVLIERSVGAGQPNVSQEILRSLRLPTPDVVEQQRIVDDLDVARAASGHLRDRIGAQLSLLQEHRQALITAAVTGELSIPGVAA